MDLDDALEDMDAEAFADADELQMADIGEDYEDGDPYGEEYDNEDN